MIVLIVGDFGVGKDTVADMFMNNRFISQTSYDFQKILSYTTRSPRYEGENTHKFCSKEEFLAFDDILAETEIGGEYYGTRISQFDLNKINLYCVDCKGVMDVSDSYFDNKFVVEVIRPKWLIDLPKERLNRERSFKDCDYEPDYRIMNDGTLEKLERSVADCFEFMKKFL